LIATYYEVKGSRGGLRWTGRNYKKIVINEDEVTGKLGNGRQKYRPLKPRSARLLPGI